MSDAPPISDTQARAAYAGQGTVSPSTAAAFAQHVRGLGGDPTASLAAYGYDPQGQPIQPATPAAAPAPATPARQPGHDSELSAAKLPRLAPSELEQAAETLSKHWTGDPAVLDAALRGAGLIPSEEAGEAELSPAEADYEASAFGASADPADYDLNGVWIGRSGVSVAEMGEVQQDMQQMLSAMAYPKSMAKAFVSDILDANERGYATLANDYERLAYSTQAKDTVMRATGAKDYASMIKIAQVALAAMPADTSIELANQGVFEDARVMTALYRQGERLIHRANLKAR
jgi:hypothetical protein